ncbi:MAG: 50S ribosomal protein L24 [Candidatus Pacearchaeota archaeon]|nr:MAG: 50S ribosomal protein L24 [Candidatus Pacearchaeota archaeon]
MKQKFSRKWKASKQPRKQRKYKAKAPLHVKHKMLATHLSKELRKKHGKRSITLRKDDVVKIIRGTFKGKQGKISIVNMKKIRVYIEGIQRTRKDGTKVNVPFNPSNLIIVELNLDDKKRNKKLRRREGEK